MKRLAVILLLCAATVAAQPVTQQVTLVWNVSPTNIDGGNGFRMGNVP